MAEESLTGTKELIFDTAIEMIATVGFENMSMRDLASAVGIKTSSLYSHFAGKQEILDSIYDYFCEHYLDNRLPAEESRRVFKTGSREEMFKTMMFDFVSKDEKKYKRMVLATKIVMMRIFNDERANRVFLEITCDKTAEITKDLLEYGISAGRLENFDVDTYSSFLIGMLFFMGIKAFARPDYAVGQLDEEKRIGKMLMDILPLK